MGERYQYQDLEAYMKICVNGTIRGMTASEEKAYREEIVTQNESDEENNPSMLENDKLTKLEEQITDIQEALCELYESII